MQTTVHFLNSNFRHPISTHCMHFFFRIGSNLNIAKNYLAMSTIQGIPAKSWINISMMEKYYYFQVVNVFFVSLVAGSAFNALGNIIDSPTSIISLLGESIPRTGYFFTNYVMLQGRNRCSSVGEWIAWTTVWRSPWETNSLKIILFIVCIVF